MRECKALFVTACSVTKITAYDVTYSITHNYNIIQKVSIVKHLTKYVIVS